MIIRSKVLYKIIEKVVYSYYHFQFHREVFKDVRQDWRETTKTYPIALFSLQPFVDRLGWIIDNFEGLAPRWKKAAWKKTVRFFKSWGIS